MIYLASDHGGYETKEKIKDLFTKKQIGFKDLGPFRSHPNDDYPDFIIPLAEMVAAHNGKGIISCRNGQGAAIVANKVHGIRAAVCWNETCAISSRTDDDSNILSLPADYISDVDLEQIVMGWLEATFSADARHVRRIDKVTAYEKTHKSGRGK